MQSTNSQTPTEIEMWWPSPEAFEDLIVEDAEHGFNLSAPDDTECGEWLTFWNQDEAHHLVFEKEFTTVLQNYANQILDANGQNEDFPDGENSDSVQAQDERSGLQPEHEPGSDSEPSS
jgi:hypothetical protein